MRLLLDTHTSAKSRMTSLGTMTLVELQKLVADRKGEWEHLEFKKTTGALHRGRKISPLKGTPSPASILQRRNAKNCHALPRRWLPGPRVLGSGRRGHRGIPSSRLPCADKSSA